MDEIELITLNANLDGYIRNDVDLWHDNKDLLTSCCFFVKRGDANRLGIFNHCQRSMVKIPGTTRAKNNRIIPIIVAPNIMFSNPLLGRPIKFIRVYEGDTLRALMDSILIMVQLVGIDALERSIE